VLASLRDATEQVQRPHSGAGLPGARTHASAFSTFIVKPEEKFQISCNERGRQATVQR